MAKNKLAGEWISPENLWGKPLPPALKRTPRATAAKVEADDDDEDEDKDDEDDTEDEDAEDEVEYDEADDVVTSAANINVEVSDKTETVSTVVDAIPTKKKKAEKNMATITPVEKKSGADYCRTEIARRAATGESLRGVDIVAALAKYKVIINPAQVSQLLKKAKESGVICTMTDKSRVAAKAKATKPAARPMAAPAAPAEVAETPRGPRHSLPKRKLATLGSMPMAQLKAASAFVAACDGCYATASSILADHKQVRSLMGT